MNRPGRSVSGTSAATDVVGQNLATWVLVNKLGHDGRLADARVAGDQQDATPAAISAPGIDPPEQPVAPAEILALVVKIRTEVKVREPIVPPAIAGRLAPEVGVDFGDQPVEAELVLVGRVAPGRQVDVVEPEDDEGGLAGARPSQARSATCSDT